METVKPFSEVLTIKQVRFQTGTTGVVFPVLEFYPTKKLRKIGINGAIFQDFTVLKKLNNGARVKVDFNEALVPNIKAIVRPSNKQVEIPKNCTHCDMKLSTVGEVRCVNLFCTATSRGFLYRLIKYASLTTPLELITLFLNKYAYMGDVIQIDNPADFRAIFTTDDKNIQAREDMWKKLHKENGEILFDLELKVYKFLKSESIQTNVFWSICNFPRLQENELYDLCALDPQKYLNGNEKATFVGLSKRLQTLLVNNHDFVVFLNDLFNSFGNKSWVPLKK